MNYHKCKVLEEWIYDNILIKFKYRVVDEFLMMSIVNEMEIISGKFIDPVKTNSWFIGVWKGIDFTLSNNQKFHLRIKFNKIDQRLYLCVDMDSFGY